MRREIILSLWAILMLFPCGLAYSAWSTDPAVNNPVSTTAYDQRSPQLVSDGSGGAIIAWTDERNGLGTTESDVYAQRLDSSGNAQWTDDGVPVTTAANQQHNPQLISDGSGGAIIVWNDSRPGASGIYAQRLDSLGNALWATDGILVTFSGNDPQLISDGSGGTIVAYEGSTGGIGVDIYAQRLDSNGNALWTAPGVPICTAIRAQELPKLISDGSGGAIITWLDGRLGSRPTYNDIYAQRVDSSGNVLWTADGVAVCTATGYQDIPQLVSDGSGGAIITWGDDERGINPDIYAQRLDPNGNALWTVDGVPVSLAIRRQSDPEIISDGSGGAIIAWSDERKGFPAWTSDIYAQRLDSSGNALWTVDGVPVSTSTSEQIVPELISDGSGGAIITWKESGDIYAQRVDSSGSALWTVNGVDVCTAIDSQWSPQLISDDSGGAIITWFDERSGTYYDIYAQLVNSNGGLGLDLPPVTVEVVPDSTTIPAGSALGYSLTITNTTDSSQTFQVWTHLTLPNGKQYPFSGELIGPLTVTLGPNAFRSAHPSLKIPAGAWWGTYSYNAYVGSYPSDLWDQSYFVFDVVSP